MSRPRHKLYYCVDSEDCHDNYYTLRSAQRAFKRLQFKRYKTLRRVTGARWCRKTWLIAAENLDTIDMYQVGETVAVCYDGKWSRAVEGIVVTKEHCKMTIVFQPWANEDVGFIDLVVEQTLTDDFRPQTGGWLIGKGENGILRMLGCIGDWYSVYKTKALLDNGYKIEPYTRQSVQTTAANIVQQLRVLI